MWNFNIGCSWALRRVITIITRLSFNTHSFRNLNSHLANSHRITAYNSFLLLLIVYAFLRSWLERFTLTQNFRWGMTNGIFIILENSLSDWIFSAILFWFWSIMLIYELINDFFLLLLAIAPLLGFWKMSLKIPEVYLRILLGDFIKFVLY